jgi:hypothetical protein
MATQERKRQENDAKRLGADPVGARVVQFVVLLDLLDIKRPTFRLSDIPWFMRKARLVIQTGFLVMRKMVT